MGSFCWGAKSLRVLHFQNTLDLGNSDSLSKNNSACAWIHYTGSKKPLQNKETQVQVPMHTQLSRQSRVHNATKGSSNRFTLILSVSMPSTSLATVNALRSSSLLLKVPALFPLHIPLGEQARWTSLAHHPREWCRVSNKLKWTFLRNHFPDPQKCGSSTHTPL